MQSLLENWKALEQGNWALPAACFLLVAVALQVLLVLFGTVRRQFAASEQYRLATQRLNLQIEAARLRCQEVEQTKLLWNGYRKFKVVDKIRECTDVFSFYLAPHDGKPLAPFRPGQYLTFQLNIPGESEPEVRCYSLSDGPDNLDRYRVTIKLAKQQDGSPGKVSSFFCNSVKPGDLLDVKAPCGEFFLDMSEKSPIVLVSGGVGITPMLSMLNAVLAAKSRREVWFFYGVRNRADHIQKDYLEQAARSNENLHLHVCYSQPGQDDREKADYHHKGRQTVDVFKKVLPSNNYKFFLCGPGAMMNGITDELKAWGVPEKNVFFEAFGPATVTKAAPIDSASAGAVLPAIKVTFTKSGKDCSWRPDNGSLLDLALYNGVKIKSGCRIGNCGTCQVAIKSGKVDTLPGRKDNSDAGSCLACICKPQTDLVLDA